MKKKYRKVMGLAMAVALAAAVPAAAGSAGTETSEFASVDWAIEPRGQYISSSRSGITNKGSGVIGITASTTAHEEVDKIEISLYLDRLEGGSWNQVADFEYTFLPSDMPNGKLTKATPVSYTHLDVYKRQGYTLTDLNSTNGTWVRGKALMNNETVFLEEGDEIYIADCGFRFL